MQSQATVYRLVVAAIFMLLGFGGGVFFTLHEYVIGAIFLGFGALTALTSPRLIRIG